MTPSLRTRVAAKLGIPESDNAAIFLALDKALAGRSAQPSANEIYDSLFGPAASPVPSLTDEALYRELFEDEK